MTNRIKLKRNAVANAVPSAGDLEYGELAINYTDGNLFFKDNGNAIQTIASLKFANVSGNVTGGNLVTSGTLSVTGNANVGNLGTAGVVATGAITGSTTLNITGNITGGNIDTAGQVSATGAVRAFELFSTQSTGDEGGQLNLALAATNTTLSGGVVIDVYQNRVRIFESGGTNRGGYFDIANLAAGVSTNLAAGGGGTPTSIVNGTSNVVVAANSNVTVGVNGITVGTFWSGGFVSTGNVTGGNLTTSNLVSSGTLNTTGNANVGNLGTAGLIVATGNVTGGNLVTTGLTSTATLNATGNANVGNLGTAGQITATGNVTGGNLITAGNVSATGNVSANYFIGNGSQLTGISTTSSAFSTIAVTGQTSIVANGATTLTLESIYTGATGNMVIYTYTGNNTVQFADATLGFWQQNEDFGLVTDPVTSSQDLGLVTDAITEQWNLGNVADTFDAVQANGLYVPNTAVFDGNVTVNNLSVTGSFALSTINNPTFTGTVTGNLIPSANAVYNLGNATNQWKDLYLSGNTMYIGSAQISASGANIVLPATVQIGNATLTASGNTLALPPDITATTLTLSGNASIAGNTSLTGNVTVSNATTLSGNTSITGNLVANVTFVNNRGITFTDGSVLQSANTFMIIAVSDETTALTTGTAKVTFRAPFAMTLPQVPRASLTTASSSGNVAVDINAGGNSILSTVMTINANQTTSTTASAAPVLSTTSIADDAQITIDIDSAGTNAAGLKVTLYYRRANL